MSIIVARTGSLGEVLFEEPEVARYIALTETAGGFRLSFGKSDPEQTDRHIQQIHAPGLLNGSAPVIFYRTRHREPGKEEPNTEPELPTFSVRLTATLLTKYTFVKMDPPERSWHEIIPAGALKTQDNELVFGVSGKGTVIFGDVVILYTSNELTVRKPLVLTRG